MARQHTLSLLLLLSLVESPSVTMTTAQRPPSGTTTNTSLQLQSTTAPNMTASNISTMQTPNTSQHAVPKDSRNLTANDTNMKELDISASLNNSVQHNVDLNETSWNSSRKGNYFTKGKLGGGEVQRMGQFFTNLENRRGEVNQTKISNITYQKLEKNEGPNATWRDMTRTFIDKKSTSMPGLNYSLGDESLTTVEPTPAEGHDYILVPQTQSQRIICEYDFEIGCFRSNDVYNGSDVDLAGIVVLIKNVTTSLATIDWRDFNISQPFPEPFYVYVYAEKFSTEVSLTKKSGEYVFQGLFSGETYSACVLSERWVQRNKDCTPCCGQFKTEGKDDHVYGWPLINRLAIVITAFLFIIVMWGVGTACYSNDYTLLVEESDFPQNGY
ncbi:uncharacterized protein LOC118430574 isoform X2 [Branchiostoma floridae]|uniref:Uncharacterized protein LOC118430574 isoform X2 n=1 Tax=Branchiostoma floridae TaxID=7739 RepID=A0A9J7MA64_BRAFL|nr:uncharacterized protein LOC118430574 isoform X2 [Branchiostoma floridae]XP_035697422.1 uncharacterized protein LOC118430574 isoform X2 [Branchiostoma floridae]XP_035697423.1 uncharacterized protein LOC118430574 isoform X2 [Branchiostoma floridae]XP_035697424.1 uncharacterized protein LOC118430574 isoform X2 [Branchiostoma floridae]